MAVYSQFATGYDNGEYLVANESYSGTADLYKVMEETSINTHAIFNHIIGCDFSEVMAEQGIISESSLEAINEASLKGIFGKVIEFFKKIGEKIKGILQNAITKLNGLFMKDTKQLFKKYEKTVIKKLNTNTYTDSFTYKYCKPKEAIDETLGKNNIASEVFEAKLPNTVENTNLQNKDIREILTFAKQNISKSNKHVNNFSSYNDKQKNDSKELLNSFNKEDNKTNKLLTSDDLKEYKDNILSKFLSKKVDNSTTDANSFAKDMDEALFDDEETKEGFNSSILDVIRKCLCDNKSVTNLEKEKREIDKQIKEKIKEAEKYQKEMNNLSSKESFAAESGRARLYASTVISMGNVCNTCVTMLYNSFFAAIKKDVKQCRAIFIKAATYNKKKSANESALLEEVVQISNDEVDEILYDF